MTVHMVYTKHVTSYTILCIKYEINPTKIHTYPRKINSYKVLCNKIFGNLNMNPINHLAPVKSTKIL